MIGVFSLHLVPTELVSLSPLVIDVITKNINKGLMFRIVYADDLVLRING